MHYLTYYDAAQVCCPRCPDRDTNRVMYKSNKGTSGRQGGNSNMDEMEPNDDADVKINGYAD
jgi:hypothetical protein